MKVLVISDSHNKVDNIKNIMNNIGRSINVVIHLGDCFSDLDEITKLYPKHEYYSVAGNCDFDRNKEDQKIINILNSKVFITHGHNYSVKYNYDRLYYKAQEFDVNICLFGHTHLPVIFYYNSILFMNPGSVAYPREFKQTTYGILDFENNGNITPTVVGQFPNGINKVIDVFE